MLDKYSKLTQIFEFLSFQQDLGGLNHQGKNSFGLRTIGIINSIVLLVVVIINFKILKPVLEGKILKIGTDWKPMDELKSINLHEFNLYTNFKLSIKAY